MACVPISNFRFVVAVRDHQYIYIFDRRKDKNQVKIRVVFHEQSPNDKLSPDSQVVSLQLMPGFNLMTYPFLFGRTLTSFFILDIYSQTIFNMNCDEDYNLPTLVDKFTKAHCLIFVGSKRDLNVIYNSRQSLVINKLSRQLKPALQWHHLRKIEQEIKH